MVTSVTTVPGVNLSSCLVSYPARRFVEREMFKSEEVPERHNLCFFPTVNDIKNHIHEAQKTCQQAGVTADVTQVTTS